MSDKKEISKRGTRKPKIGIQKPKIRKPDKPKK